MRTLPSTALWIAVALLASLRLLITKKAMPARRAMVPKTPTMTPTIRPVEATDPLEEGSWLTLVTHLDPSVVVVMQVTLTI